MNGYVPPFKITDEIISYVSSISEKVGKITVCNNIESKPHLRRNNRIKSIHSSLKIEANSLSLNQVRDIIDRKLVIGEKKEIQEVKNAYDAYEQIKNINPYNIQQLKQYHGIMMKYLVEESGEFRRGDEGVFKDGKVIFIAPPPYLVTSLMNDLFDWMNEVKSKLHPLILSCIFHYEFVFIHPFSDGNGRMARLWHMVILSKWNPIFEYIPLESQVEKFQEEYYQAISKCHSEGESTAFIEFMLLQIDKILDEVLSSTKYDKNDVCDHLNKLLMVMEDDISYSCHELMNKLSLQSRDGFRRNYLVPAVNMKLICMTKPDKVTSKNQRYYKNIYD